MSSEIQSTPDDVAGSILLFAASTLIWHKIREAKGQTQAKRGNNQLRDRSTHGQTSISAVGEPNDSTIASNKQQDLHQQSNPQHIDKNNHKTSENLDYISSTLLKQYQEEIIKRRRLSFQDFQDFQPQNFTKPKLIKRSSLGSERFHHHFDFDHDFQSIDSESFGGSPSDEEVQELNSSSFKQRRFKSDSAVEIGRVRHGVGISDNDSNIMSSNNHELGSFGDERFFDKNPGPGFRRPSVDYDYAQPKNVFGEHTESIDRSNHGFASHYDNDVSSLSRVREVYNSKIMPRRLVMIRHGQSEGNVNESLYTKVPDSNIRLTKLGWDQAKLSGQILRKNILRQKKATVHFIVSPYIRCMETFHGLASAWCDPNQFSHIEDEKERLRIWYNKLADMGVTFNEDPRIREQDFGNYQDRETIKKAKVERYKFGIFYYRFPNGESASDVFDRISTFLDSLWRSFCSNPSKNYVLVTHGISIRVLLARYFRYTVDQFNVLVRSFLHKDALLFQVIKNSHSKFIFQYSKTKANPSNCEMIILGHDGHGKLELEGRCELKNPTSSGDKTGEASYQFYEKLKVARGHTGHRKIRMDYCE